MAEEQRLEEGTHRLCANGCGFSGDASTGNLCSKCFRDIRLKEEQAAAAMLVLEKSSSSSAAAAAAAAATGPSPRAAVSGGVDLRGEVLRKVRLAAGPVAAAVATPGRCGECRKKVGLTGFKCRCGTTYCGAHRYPEKHACVFDYKAAGREEIARANPVVKADKLVGKI